jgi:hypothetical protein
MNVTTNTKVDRLSEHKARLIVEVIWDGEMVGSVVVASGPPQDIEDLHAGRATPAEVRKRWGMK